MATLPTAVPEVLARYREPLERALREAVGDEPPALAAAARYVLGWEDEHGRPAHNAGKRIRPALCLLGAEVAGGTIEDAMPGACAVELVHNFSLVHDEVQDHDAERHHRPTLWALLGEAQAINAGDFLYTRAVQAISDGPGDPGRRMAGLSVLNRAIQAMIGGQWDDLDFERRESVHVEEYLAMVAGKTGALLSAPLEIGALLAGADAGFAAGLGAWGKQVGLAFQAQDDYLGTWGNPGETGKSNSNDIARKKKTLPIVYGMDSADARAAILGAYDAEGDVSANAIARVVQALEVAGADTACREMAAEYAHAADALLDGLGLPAETRALLRDVARYLVDRAG